MLLLGEPARILELNASPEWNMKVFVWGSLVTGFFGFLLCVAGLLSIKVTSPVTHMFSSVRPYLSASRVIDATNPVLSQAARSVIQTLLGVWLFQDVLTV